jgi:alpha-L-arabinofuranosidase
VKVINTKPEAVATTINIAGLKAKNLPATADVISLDCSDYDAENMPSRPEVVSPKASTVTLSAAKAGASIAVTVPAKTFQVYKIRK